MQRGCCRHCPVWSWPARGQGGTFLAPWLAAGSGSDSAPPGAPGACQGEARRGRTDARGWHEPQAEGVRGCPAPRMPSPGLQQVVPHPYPDGTGEAVFLPEPTSSSLKVLLAKAELRMALPAPSPRGSSVTCCSHPPGPVCCPSPGHPAPRPRPSSHLAVSVLAVGIRGGCLPHSFRGTREGAPLCPPGPSSSCSPGRQAIPALLALLP